MKIVLAGGGTGGHFNPLIAVAEEIKTLAAERKLVAPQIFYLADRPFDERALFENNIVYFPIVAGKWRRYFSLQNFVDLFRVAWGCVQAIWRLYRLFPDVVFSKGGYASFPVMVAARLLKIPVIIHESDSRPGRVNRWSGKFAARIAVSYPTAVSFFPEDCTAVTGNPIRQELRYPIKDGAHEYLKLDPAVPVIFVTGGSLGAAMINDIVLDIAPRLVEKYQIIHQVGAVHLADVEKRSRIVFANSPQANRYKAFDYLNENSLRMVAGIADIAISRAGSIIFELALWGLPAILVPIPEEVSHDQRTNAFTYARAGGAIVIEQKNLTGSILEGEIHRLVADAPLRAEMSAAGRRFARPEAARDIANALLAIALEHEE